MAEELLLAYLRNEIRLESITNWLKSHNGSDSDVVFANFCCCQRDFIAYFINFIHEDGLGDVKSNEAGMSPIPEKDQNIKSAKLILKKRARLQPVRESGQSQSFTFTTTERPQNWSTSTPKAKNKNPNRSLPSWPQKPNNRKRPQTKDRSFNLGDFLVKPSEKQKKRRIKPTAVEDDPTFEPLQTSFENFVNSSNEATQDFVVDCLKCTTPVLSDVQRKQVMLANRLRNDGTKQVCACDIADKSYSEKFERRFKPNASQVETSLTNEPVCACLRKNSKTDKFEGRPETCFDGYVGNSFTSEQVCACLQKNSKIEKFEGRFGQAETCFDGHVETSFTKKPVCACSQKMIKTGQVETCSACGDTISKSENRLDQPNDFPGNNNIDTSLNQSSSSKFSKSEVIPRYEFCRNLDELDKLVDLFVYFLENSLLLGLISELHFLLTILVSHCYKDSEEDLNLFALEDITSKKALMQLFFPVHNRVYFSLEILRKSVKLLHIFDKSTLELLLNNERVQNFGYGKSVVLLQDLESIISWKKSAIDEMKQPVAVQSFESTSAKNVNFSSETDNRENFPNDASFHAFKKQRDMFYDYFWTWEERRTCPDWNFAFALGQKVKSLFNLYDDPVNYRQFAGLFVSQMVLVCHKENEGEKYMHNEAAILQKLPGIDSSKLTKLKFRLLTKNDTNSTNAAPNFLGIQEFFKDFIVNCSNSIFYEHLKDVLVSELLSQDDVEFTGYEFDRREVLAKHQATAGLVIRLKKVRILAKFLGFVESLPYQCDYEKLSKKVLRGHLAIRQHYRSSIDLKSVILKAIDKRKIIFSISWIAVYLSMLDYVTLRLPYFVEIYKLLFRIYKTSEAIEKDNIVLYTVLLARVSLGCLFELPYFPSSLYYDSLENIKDSEKTLDNLWSFGNSGNRNGYFSDIFNGYASEEFPVDRLDIVDGATIYACCPSLEKFKTLLSTGQNKYVGGIKRFPVQNVDKAAISQEHVERRLEEAFLLSHPPAFRKSIEFINERIYAGCIQYLSSHVVPILKKDQAAAFERSVKGPRLTAEDRKFLEAKHMKEIENGIEDITKDMRKRCLEIAGTLISDKVEKAMFGLLRPDELPSTVETAVSITVRMCLRRIKTWMDDALTLATVEKMVVHELRKILHSKPAKISSVLPCNGRPVLHDDKTFSAADVSQNLRNLMITSLERKVVTEDCIKSMLGDCKITINNRCDVNDNITLCIHKQTIDFYLVLLTFQMDISELVLEIFIEYWLEIHDRNQELFNMVICPRNIRMLSQSLDIDRSWKFFEKFLVTLHRNKLLGTAGLEQQCLRIYKHEWDKETLGRISSCCKNLIDNIKDSRESLEGLVTFMSNFSIGLGTC